MTNKTNIKSIIESLQSPLEAQRELAVQALVKTNDIRSIPALQRVAGSDESVRIRYQAKKALFVLKRRLEQGIPGGGTEPQHIKTDKVREILAGPDPAKKLGLLKVIARHKLATTIPLLFEAAKSEQDAVVRSNIIIVVGILGDEAHIGDIAAYVHDRDPRVRANAIEALEYINHPNAYPIIVNALSDSDNRIRANAIKALRNYGKVNVINLLRKMLQSSQEWMRDSAAYALSLVAKNEAISLLLDSANDETATVRQRARAGLANLAKRGNPTASKALEEIDKHLDSDGVPPPLDLSAFKELADGASEESLLQAEDAQVRLKELRSIVDEQDSSRLFEVVEMAQTEQDAFLKANAVIALGKLGDENLIDTLSEFLSSSEDRIRANDIEALAMIGGERVSSVLVPCLQDSNNRCKANAIIALKSHPYINVTKPLEEMVTSTEVLQRKSAFYAITDIATDEVILLLDPLHQDPEEDISKNARQFLQMLSEQGNAVASDILSRSSAPKENALDSLNEEFFDQDDSISALGFAGFDDSSDGAPGFGTEDSQGFAVGLELELEGFDESATSESLPSSVDQSKSPHVEFPTSTAVKDISSLELQEEKPFRYSVDQFINLPNGKKRSIIEELKNEITVQAYLFLREILNDKDFEIKCLAKVALKNFENEDFAGPDAPKPSDRGWIFATPEIETVEYQGLKKTIMLSRDLNEKAEAYEYAKTWKGPFPVEFPILNALREDTQEMIQFILRDEELRHVLICFQHDRMKPFMEGRRSLDGNRFANVVTLSNVSHRIEPYSPSAKLLKTIKRPIYLLVLFTDDKLFLFLRGPLETSFGKFLSVNYQQIDNVEISPVNKGLKTLVLHIHNDYIEIPEMYAHIAKPFHEFITERCVENLKKEQLSGRFDPKEELKKLETLLQAGAIAKTEYSARRKRIERMLALSGVHSKAQINDLIKRAKAQKITKLE